MTNLTGLQRFQAAPGVRFGQQQRVIPHLELNGNDHAGDLVRFISDKRANREDLRYRMEPTVEVITNQRDFQKLLGVIALDSFQPPTVDFDRQAVIVVLDPPSTAGSPRPSLEKMTYDGHRLQIALRRPDTEFAATVMGNPYYVAVVDKNKAENLPVVL